MNTVNTRPGHYHRPGYFSDSLPLLASGVVNWRLTLLPHIWRPPTDFIEGEDKYVLRVEIPGMRDGEFSVSVENNLLTISGVRTDLSERKAFHQMEIHFGEFATEVELPKDVEANQIKAEYEDGFLWVFLPKAQPKQIIVGD